LREVRFTRLAGAVVLLAVVAVVALVARDEGRRDDDPRGGKRPHSAEQRPPGARESATAARDRRAITEAQLTKHLGALQAAAGEGRTRAAGTPGDRATAEYIAARLRETGYRVSFQDVPFSFFDERSPPRLERLGEGGPLRRGRDFRTLAFSGSGRVTGRIRAIGLAPGREVPSGCARGDFAALERGEVALVQRGICRFRTKAANAQAAAAAAVIVANDGRPSRTDPPPGSLGGPGIRIPVLGLSAAAVPGLPTGTRVRLAVDADSERRTTRNVIGDAGPADARSVVMAGAHLDSVREGPGLNDNGSGVAALLEVAEAMDDDVPVRLAFWGAEEVGLIGSRRYVERLPARERRRLAAYVNLDMVGSRGRRASVYGDPEVTRALRRGLPAGVRSTSLRSGSDHAPFVRAGVPVGGIFTGLDSCYHKACDTLRNVDPRLVARAARATASALVQLARRP
jgi:hypothetical protein